MYAKCGVIEDALIVFNEILIRQTDVLIWNAVIGGLATHGHTIESVHMYKRMLSFGIRPDEIIFLCILTACAHGGLVKEAWYFFHSLHEYRMTPKCEHYACMVDVLEQAGQLTEAYKFMDNIPIKPTPSMLGALLNGCLNHRDLNLAEVVGKKLIALQPDHDGRYVGLSNVYASRKRWDEARRKACKAMMWRRKACKAMMKFYIVYDSHQHYERNDTCISAVSTKCQIQ